MERGADSMFPNPRLRAKGQRNPVEGMSAPLRFSAQILVLLAKNGYITGQTINLNGGWYMS
jgi:3-oxoacyl-[acyl-carrier protein] reductase